MEGKWLGWLLGFSLVANAILFGLFVRERGRAAANPTDIVSLVDTLPTELATDTPTPMPPATPTRRPQPNVAQATRAITATPVPATETAIPTPEPTETSQPSPTPEPTLTPGPPASPTIEAAGTDWLWYVNLFRNEANLPALVENPEWSLDSLQHSRYMVYTGNLGHNQDPGNPYFSRAGQTAAENGNIAAGYIGSEPFKWAFNYWMSAPFHAIPMLDPQLGATGFAEYRDAAGVQPVAATLDVRRGLGPLPDSVTYPIMYPRDGGETWVLRYSLPEFPEALSTCVGYQQPTGAPIILQIGDGRETPQVTGSALYRDGEYLAHCRFDETNFTHPNEFRQKSARLILDQRDAIVIIPQQPLLPDSTYSVRVDVNGATYTWSFRTVAGPP